MIIIFERWGLETYNFTGPPEIRDSLYESIFLKQIEFYFVFPANFNQYITFLCTCVCNNSGNFF